MDKYPIKIKKEFVNTAGKFIVIGLITTVLNYLVFFLLVKILKVNFIMASVTGYLTGLTLGFFLNNFWTFKSDKVNVSQAFGYVIVYLFSLGLSTLFLYVAVSKFHLNTFVMNVVAIVISTISNFIGLKFIIYHDGTNK